MKIPHIHLAFKDSQGQCYSMKSCGQFFQQQCIKTSHNSDNMGRNKITKVISPLNVVLQKKVLFGNRKTGDYVSRYTLPPPPPPPPQTKTIYNVNKPVILGSFHLENSSLTRPAGSKRLKRLWIRSWKDQECHDKVYGLFP